MPWTNGTRGHLWPSAEQRLLLEAALSPIPRAAGAWGRLEPGFDLDALEDGSFFLLPLLYARRKELSLPGELTKRLAGIHRRSWYTNTLVLKDLEVVLRALDDAGVQALLIQATPFLLRYYDELGSRPTVEVDIVVSREDAERAVAVLQEASDVIRAPAPLAMPSVRLERAPLPPYVVRWRLAEPWSAPTGSGLWARAVPLELEDVRTLSAHPSDELLHTCLRGGRGGQWPRTQWVPDALVVLRTSRDEIDWTYVVDEARALKLTRRLEAALGFLSTLGADVPEGAVTALRSAPVSRREITADRLEALSGRATGELPRAVAEHVRRTADEPLGRVVLQLPAFMREHWGLRHAWQLPSVFVRKLGGRLVHPWRRATTRDVRATPRHRRAADNQSRPRR